MKCFGRNLADHCCYIDGKPCPFLERETERDQKWSCQLRRETGSWAAAVADPRYTAADGPGPYFRQFGYDCETFQCHECGQLERGEITEEEFLEKRDG